MPIVRAERYHDISCGHRVVGHEGKCRHLHGHNYRVMFVCEADHLDEVGRVVDFSDIKRRLCEWLEEEWDHRTLLWERDPAARPLLSTPRVCVEVDEALTGIVLVPFNPTAENIGLHLLQVVGPEQLKGTGVKLVQVRVEETRKCSATVEH